MASLTLKRDLYTETCTLGSIESPDGDYWYTIEQPWNDNKPFHSCVPTGTYIVRKYKSPRFGNTYVLENKSLNVYADREEAELAGPDNRYACLIHSANRAKELQGCIAPGMVRGAIEGDEAVLKSRDALNQILAYILVHDIDTLIIEGA